MSTIKTIRGLLNMTQEALGAAIGCTQGNVWHYEHGQEIQPETAKRLIAVAAQRGLQLTLDQVYGVAELPAKPADEPAATDAKAA